MSDTPPHVVPAQHAVDGLHGLPDAQLEVWRHFALITLQSLQPRPIQVDHRLGAQFIESLLVSLVHPAEILKRTSSDRHLLLRRGGITLFDMQV